MRCPSCNKFPAFSTDTEPEVELDVQDQEMGELSQDTPDERSKDAGIVRLSGTIRVVLTSECCGDECKETTFDVSDLEIEFTRATGCACDFTSNEFCWDVDGSGEITDRTETQTKTIAKRGPNKGKEVIKQIPYRYARRYYGVDATATIKCECGKTTAETHYQDEVQASSMDEMV